MSDFTNLLGRFTNSLDDQTRTLEEATVNDSFGNQRPWEQQPNDKHQASVAHLLEPTTKGLFRELGSLNQALDECYGFVGISDTSSTGGGTPLSKLVARAHEIASSNERVLSRAQELASHLGPLRSRNNSFESIRNGSTAPCVDHQQPSKCYTPTRNARHDGEDKATTECSGAKQIEPRTPLQQLAHTNLRSKSARRTSGAMLRRSDPPTPSFEDMGLSAKSMAIIGKENTTMMATPGPSRAAATGGRSSVYRTTTSRQTRDTDTRSRARAPPRAGLWLTPARSHLPASSIDDNDVSPRSEHNTPPLPQRKYSRDYVGQELPDLLGADDDESDSSALEEEDSTEGVTSGQHIAHNTPADTNGANDTETAEFPTTSNKMANGSSETEEALRVLFPKSHATDKSASHATHAKTDDVVVVSMNDCEKLPFYLRNQMSVDDINALLVKLGDCSAGADFNDAKFNEWCGMDPAESRVALLVLIKLKRLQLISNGVYRLLFV